MVIDEYEKLKTEYERLRNAVKPVIDYWFEDSDKSPNEDFLELSNAYYNRINKFIKK